MVDFAWNNFHIIQILPVSPRITSVLLEAIGDVSPDYPGIHQYPRIIRGYISDCPNNIWVNQSLGSTNNWWYNHNKTKSNRIMCIFVLTLDLSRSNITQYWTQYERMEAKALFTQWAHNRHHIPATCWWAIMERLFWVPLLGEKIPWDFESELYFYSIAAQSNPALGALLNATFGSLTELLLYTMALFKQGDTENRCFTELVKSGFIG